MKKDYSTPQEAFWAGEFGNEYVSRNRNEAHVAGNLALFSRILSRTSGIRTAIEFGANIGLNLVALKALLPQAEFSAIEINESAASELEKIGYVDVHRQSILEFGSGPDFDLVLIKGVLIHIHPEKLPEVYDRLYHCSRRYILIAEYYNPTPVAIPYRGHADRLFKRDFAGEMLDRFADLTLLDYGFSYHRDCNFPQDDLTWFLLEKK